MTDTITARQGRQLLKSAKEYDKTSSPRDKRKLEESLLQMVGHIEKVVAAHPRQTQPEENQFLSFIKKAGQTVLELAPSIIPVITALL
jgi:hypothetical protein